MSVPAFPNTPNPYQAPQVSEPAMVPSSPRRGFLSYMFSFSGRFSRSQWWGVVGIWFAVLMVFGIIEAVLQLSDDALRLLIIPFYIVYFWTHIAAQVKRWHDHGYSGWMVLVNIIPLAPLVVFVFIACLRGTRGRNQYGPDPLGGPDYPRTGLAGGSSTQPVDFSYLDSPTRSS